MSTQRCKMTMVGMAMIGALAVTIVMPAASEAAGRSVDSQRSMVTGAIISINVPARKIQVKEPDGNSMTLTLHPSATISKDGRSIPIDELKVGQTVTVLQTERDGKNQVSSIEVTAAPAGASAFQRPATGATTGASAGAVSRSASSSPASVPASHSATAGGGMSAATGIGTDMRSMISGTIRMIDLETRTMQLAEPNGRVVSLTIAPSAMAMRDGQSVALSQLQIGQNVTVRQSTQEGSNKVTSIEANGAGSAAPSGVSSPGSLPFGSTPSSPSSQSSPGVGSPMSPAPSSSGTITTPRGSSTTTSPRSPSSATSSPGAQP